MKHCPTCTCPPAGVDPEFNAAARYEGSWILLVTGEVTHLVASDRDGWLLTRCGRLVHSNDVWTGPAFTHHVDGCRRCLKGATLKQPEPAPPAG